MSDNSIKLGLWGDTYQSLMALVAVLVGFVFLFFGVYIVVDVAKK